jgi:ABC-type dipeptide/oligopeptide/nickel transport system permease component
MPARKESQHVCYMLALLSGGRTAFGNKWMSVCTIGLSAILYSLPWWWLRIALALLVTASGILPIRRVLRNDGNLRRRLWRGIGV